MQTLKGAPEKIIGFFACNENPLFSYEGGPVEIGERLYINNTFIEDLDVESLLIGGNIILNEFLQEKYQIKEANMRVAAKR